MDDDEVKVNASVIVPPHLNIPNHELTIILGNLLDNALDAVAECENKWLDVVVKYSKGRLFFKVHNGYHRILLNAKGELLGTKREIVSKGVGIQSVQEVIDKYHGLMQGRYQPYRFEVELMLYC